MPPRISIIIPVHNAQNTIERCVNSFISQFLSFDYEILLIENGSKDDSYLKCQELAAKNANVIFRKNLVSGVSAARNFGLQISRGEIVVFCDSDDYIRNNTLEKLIRIFDQKPYIDVVVAGYMYVYDDTKYERAKCHKKSFECDGKKFAELILTDDKVFGGVWNKLYRKRYVKNFSFQEKLIYCEDVKFNVESAMGNPCSRIFISDVLYYNYVQSTTSITNDPQKLFDEKDQLNATNALKELRAEYLNDSRIYKIVSAKIFSLSVIAESEELSTKQKDLIVKDIKENQKYFHACWLICPMENFKFQIKRLMGSYWLKIKRKRLRNFDKAKE